MAAGTGWDGRLLMMESTLIDQNSHRSGVPAESILVRPRGLYLDNISQGQRSAVYV